MLLPLLLLLLLVRTPHSLAEIRCPPYEAIPFCSCFVLDDQLHVQCSGPTVAGLSSSLRVLNGPVKSFSVYDLDPRASILPNGVTDNVTSPVYHLQISHSSLTDLGESSLAGLAKSLESLALVSSRLSFIPQSTLATLKRLKLLDLEANQVSSLEPYSFHKILLQRLNLKGNLLENVSEHAFWGLEETLMEVDMSENKLRVFPFGALSRLRLLSSLNLAWNEIPDLSPLIPRLAEEEKGERPGRSGKTAAFDLLRHSLKMGSLPGKDKGEKEGKDGSFSPPETEWPLLKYLNLNSNFLRGLEKGSFLSMRNLRQLSIHLNSIESLHPEVFLPLRDLETLDLSHNKMALLPDSLFKGNTKLVSIDLSNNHLHSVGRTFQGLPDLRELFLNGNNILQLEQYSFLDSGRISVLYLQGNSLRFLESGALQPLKNLTEVRLSDNFLRTIEQDAFSGNEALTSVSLDGNQLGHLVPGTFSRLGKLRELRLQNNQLSFIEDGVLPDLSSLEEVHFENNRLKEIKGLPSLRKLRHVTLSRNNLEFIRASLIPSVELNSLSLGHNQIKGIEDAAFSNQTSLAILFLGSNKLTRLGQKAFLGLRSLERLYLSKNNISWIHGDSFSSQTKALQYLDLSYNSLKTINSFVFSGLAFIEEINLSHNEITSLDDGAFSNLRSLRNLDLSGNLLTVIHYPETFHPGGLEILKLSSNALTELHIPGKPEKLVALKELDLQGNQLTASVLRALSLPRLEVLQVSGNNLTDLDDAMLEGFPSLGFFSGEGSHMTQLPSKLFKANSLLAVIRLSDNSISHVPDAAFSHSSIRELHLRGNKLRAFPYKALTNASNLEVLTLSGNRINTLDLNRISLPRLKQLDMNDNRLTKIMGGGFAKGMPLLEVVDFGENNISRINDELMKNVSLSQLNFGGNALSRIPSSFTLLTSSFVLNMSGNPLTTFHLDPVRDLAFPSGNVSLSVMDLYLVEGNLSFLTLEEFHSYPLLHRLVIKRNPLSLLPPGGFSSLENLSLLDLSENRIEDVRHDSFTGLLTLKSLNLSNNVIKAVQPFSKDLQGLQDLDLSFNQLSRLVPETFANLISLVTLRLRGNWLTSTLPTELFGPLARLAFLDLSANFMEALPSPLLRHLETRIASLKLEENPVSCDCDSKDFFLWLSSHPKLSDSSLLICDRPEEVRGQPFLSLLLDSACSSPAILKLAIQDVQPSSAVISWQGRNNSLMQGYMIGYHALNHDTQVRWTRPLPPVSKAYRLPDLESDTPYLICVLGLSEKGNATTSPLTLLSAESLLRDSPVSKCTKVRTSVPSSSDTFSFLQRRMGVVVGAGVGLFVFLLLMSILTCVKLRKKRPRSPTNGHPQGQGPVSLGKDEGPYHTQQHHLPTTIPTFNGNGNGNNNGGEFLSYRMSYRDAEGL